VETRDVPVLRVVFNLYDGRPEGGPRRSIYDPDLPIYVLREFAEPRQTTRFVIPEVPAGTYNVGIFDGSERGKHFTSAPFVVVAAPSPEDVNAIASGRDAGIRVPVTAAAGGGFLVGVGVGVAFARRRSSAPRRREP